MTLIDLGELRDGPEPEEAPRRPRNVGRPWRVALVLVLLTATMAGAAPAAARVSAVVSAPLGAEAYVTGDRVYVVQPAQQESDRTLEVVAYPRPERPGVDRAPVPHWRSRVPVPGRLWNIQAGGGVVLLALNREGDRGGETVALDAATGRQRWRQPGFTWLDAAGTLLLEDTSRAGPGSVRSAGGEDADQSGVGVVRSVDPATGRALWSVPSPLDGVQFGVRDGVVDRLVLIPPTGPVEVRDPRTGALLHSAELRPGELPTFQQATVLDDLLLVVRPQAGVVAAYELDGLRRRWEVTMPLVNYVVRCGELICASGQTGGIRALDRATGAVRWSGERWTDVLFGVDGRLLAIDGENGVERLGVLDLATGREVADLGTRWQLTSWPYTNGVLAVRPVARGKGVLVADLDVVAGRVRPRDVLQDASGDCRGDGDTLVCRLHAGGFGVWRVGA